MLPTVQRRSSYLFTFHRSLIIFQQFENKHDSYTVTFQNGDVEEGCITNMNIRKIETGIMLENKLST